MKLNYFELFRCGFTMTMSNITALKH